MSKSTSKLKRIHYVTSSDFKKEENRIFASKWKLKDGTAVSNVVDFHITPLAIKEVLEVDIAVMVQAEVAAAYSQIKVPCIVEHAGLVFDGYTSYPGGLTKPMWNTLEDRFLLETRGENRSAIARAVVAYCDGSSIRTFVGETIGHLSDRPRGSRKFYWDTVFIPDSKTANPEGLTYAELVESSKYGLEYKIEKLSQSSKALAGFVEYFRGADAPLWA